MKAALVLLALCVVAVSAQHVRRCEAPHEFEAHVWQSDFEEKFVRRGHLAYDFDGQRTSFYEHVDNHSDHEAYHVIRLFQMNMAYRINLKTKVCQSETLNYPFIPFGIRREAQFVGDAILGTNAFENSGLLTTHWTHSNQSAHMEWYGVFTDREIGCIPVSDDYSDDTVGHVRTQFYDVVLGISDPNVFNVPDSCPNAPQSDKPVAKATSYVRGEWTGPVKKQPQSTWALFKQCDPTWANQELGTCGGTTICAAGCAMSSTAMILRTRGVATNPGALDTWLTNHGGYEGGCDIVWGSVDAFGKTSFQGIENADYDTICTGLKAGHGIIGNVRGGSHWVLLTGCDNNGNFYVNDPGFNQNSYSFSDVLREAVYH